ncbi:MAG: DUF3592 domain-containing protein [Deltaproteobacteria bacterium]|nr:DUF3592 domain-containing protein [Deltaproteobacteria bacterium]
MTDPEPTMDVESSGAWYSSPMPPMLLLLVGLVLLFQDGLTPYEILWKRTNWKKVTASRAKITVTTRRVQLRPGVVAQDPDLVQGHKSGLAIEAQADSSDRRFKESQAVGDRTDVRTTEGQQSVPAPLIEMRVVKKGVIFTYMERRYFVLLSYRYRFKGKVYTRFGDEAPQDFKTRKDAVAYLHQRVPDWPIKVWVNPKHPRDASAFLDYDGWLAIRLGALLFVGSLFWLLFFGIGRRSKGDEGLVQPGGIGVGTGGEAPTGSASAGSVSSSASGIGRRPSGAGQGPARTYGSAGRRRRGPPAP